MGLFGKGGLESAFSVAALIGQDIVARSISLTQTAGNVAVQLITGAKLKLGSGTTDYLTSNGSARVVAAGDFEVDGTLGVLCSTGFYQALAADTAVTLIGNVNNGATAVANVSRNGNSLTTGGAQIHAFFSDNGVTKVFAIDQGGKIMAVPNTDSSGSPGNATANTPTGKAAIAIGASSCVISNTLVTAASRIFISPRIRDATGLLPIVSAQTAGTSFTVSTTANCTAALTFDWWLLN